jgi:hypothetical protein
MKTMALTGREMKTLKRLRIKAAEQTSPSGEDDLCKMEAAWATTD